MKIETKILLENLPIGYALHKIVLNKDGNPCDYIFIDVNPLFEEYTGLQKKAIIGKSILEILPEIIHDKFDWINYYGKITLNKTIDHFVAYSEPLQRSYKVTVYSPAEMYFITFFSDHSEKLALDEKLRFEKQMSEITLLSVGDGVIATDKFGAITLMNSAGELLTGWKTEDAIGKNIEEVFRIHNDITGEKCENIVDKVITNGVKQELANHTVLIQRFGAKIEIADSAAPIKKANGEVIGVVIVFRDYSDKYRKEREISKLLENLQKTQILLKSSLESATDILIISLDTDYRYLYFNETHRIDMISAYNTEIKVGDCIFDYMTSEQDIKNLKANYDIALSGKAHTTLEQYGDIQINYYETKFNPIYNRSNEVIGLSVFAQNVTERYKMKQEIILNEKRYRGLVDNLDAGVVIHTEDTSILFVNDTAAKLLGVTKESLLSKHAVDPVFQFINEDNLQLEIDEYPVNLIRHSKKPLRDYIIGIHQENSNYIVWVSVNGIPIMKQDGSIEEIVISFTDITEKKRTRLQLEYSANYDYLTGLFNRRYFEEKLLSLDVEENYPLTIIMADINGLKLINDAFGHINGDDLLISAANVIAENCRRNDLLARIGGDEFAIAMPKTTENEAGEVISKIKLEASKILTQSIPLSISFGYVSKKDSKDDIHEIYRSSEDMMYREKLLEIPSMRSVAIETILKTLYEKDQESEKHSRAVSKLSERIATMLGMSIVDTSSIRTAGLLHDIGKIIIPSNIITKKGLLTDSEYTTIKKHPEIGYRILNSTQNLRAISEIVLNHHEHWDGRGYPRGIKGEMIPLESRIISIADAFDAMTSKRVYRKTLTNEEALEEIIRCSGTQFDPRIAKLFRENFVDIIKD